MVGLYEENKKTKKKKNKQTITQETQIQVFSLKPKFLDGIRCLVLSLSSWMELRRDSC